VSPIPFVDLPGRHAQSAPEVEARVLEVLRSGRYIGGPVVHEAEAIAARLLGRRGAVGVGSGTDALMLALQAVGVTPGDEVIVPALSFFATAGAVLALGAVPVVVDVDDMGLMDPEAAAAARTDRSRAVLPVHLFGSQAPAPDLGLPVVDDACQAVGASPSCSVGTLSAVSAYPTKLWGAAGDGGFVVGDDGELLERVRALGHHGTIGPHLHDRPVPGWAGRNNRLDAIQAAVLVGRAPGLESALAHRRELVARYDAGLTGDVRPLPRTAGSPASPYVVRAPDRRRVVEALANASIGASVYYPRSLAAQPALRGARRPTPRADALAAELLALPLHETTTIEQVDRVLDVLSAVS